MIISKSPSSSIGVKIFLLFAAVFVIFLVPGSLGLTSNDACFDGGCHTSPDQRPINRSLYESNPHSIIECVDCHVNSTSSNDSDHGQFVRTLNGSNITGPLTTTYSSQNFALCYYCHEEANVVGILPDYIPSEYHVNAPIIVSSIGTNFINTDSAGYHNGSEGGGPDIPTNIHWNHLDGFGSINTGSVGKFDYNMSGNRTSYQSCPACHNVHGTNYPKMTKNDLAITYSFDINGTFGYIGSDAYLYRGGDLYCGAGCHTNGTTFKYYRNEINLFEDCISCHDGGVPDDVNKTAFSYGVHVNINTTNGSGIVDNSDCWTCHYQRDMNRSNIYTCANCHVEGAVPTAPRVTSHKPEKVNKTCEGCHGLVELDPGLNNDSISYPNITAHYAQRPVVPTENYCDYCHGPNPSSPFPALNRTISSFFHNSSNASFPENSTCRTCHTRTDVPADPLAMNNSSFHDLSSEYGDVNNGTTIVNCINCHVNHEPQFAIAPEPPHSTTGMAVDECYLCHGTGIEGTNVQKLHDVRAMVKTNCILCHAINDNDVNVSLFGRHMNVNTTGGIDNTTDDDCKTCHFGAQTGDLLMVPGAADSTNTYYCQDCHIDGKVSAPNIKNHRPPRLPVRSQGANITTTAYCTTCHNNSINQYANSINASISHYATNISLIKYTVNQTSMPRFGFMNAVDASAYNSECNNCHNPSNPDYGNATLITTAHTNRGTCNECHVNMSASDLHNDSLGLPQTFGCKDCHTIYADKYKAPNLIGTNMGLFSATSCEGCHGGGNNNGLLDTLSEHNTNRNFTAGKPGRTDIVYLNNQIVLSVTKGTIITVTSRVNDTAGDASRVGGAEYYIDTDPGAGKGTPMDPVDGQYNAANKNWENVTGTIDTNNLSEGTHTVYVRGMDIGKQWSTPKNATFMVRSIGYVNGTVTSGGLPVAGAIVSVTGVSTSTSTDGNYSLILQAGTYDVTAGKRPEYEDNTITGIEVTQDNTTIQNFILALKPTGTVSGTVVDALTSG